MLEFYFESIPYIFKGSIKGVKFLYTPLVSKYLSFIQNSSMNNLKMRLPIYITSSKLHS